MDTVLSEVWKLLSANGPFVALLSFVIFAGYKRWWRWGYQFDEMAAHYERELANQGAVCQEWKSLFYRQIGITQVAVEKVTPPVVVLPPGNPK